VPAESGNSGAPALSEQVFKTPTIDTAAAASVATPQQQNEQGQVEAGSAETISQESATSGKSDTHQGTPKGVQKRLGELSGERDAARAEAEEARNRAAEAERRLAEFEQRAQAAQAAQLHQEELKPPKREDFEDPDAYADALTDYKVEKRLRERDAQQAESLRQQTVQTQEEVLNKRWSAAVADVKARLPDYDQVTNSDIQISGAMAHAMREASNGPEIAYHLGKNPDEAARIAALPPVQALMEVGRISAQLAGQAKKPVSRTAAPISTVSGGERATVSLQDMSMDDYVKAQQERNGGKSVW
jgi:hypothetical protein